MWVQNKMGTRLETALAQRSRRSFQNFWVTTGRLNFLWSNVLSRIFKSRNKQKKNFKNEIVLVYFVATPGFGAGALTTLALA